MSKYPVEYYRYLVTGPRDREWGPFVTGAGYQPSVPGTDSVPHRPYPSEHFYVWEQGRVLHEYALGLRDARQRRVRIQGHRSTPAQTGN